MSRNNIKIKQIYECFNYVVSKTLSSSVSFFSRSLDDGYGEQKWSLFSPEDKGGKGIFGTKASLTSINKDWDQTKSSYPFIHIYHKYDIHMYI